MAQLRFFDSLNSLFVVGTIKPDLKPALSYIIYTESLHRHFHPIHSDLLQLLLGRTR